MIQRNGLDKSEIRIDDLHDTDLPAILADVQEHDDHFHTANKVYGKDGTTSLMVQEVTTPLTVEGGNDAYGTQPLLHKGTMDESTYDLGKMQVTAVDTANSPTLIRFYTGVLGSGVACTGEADDDIVTAAGHGVVNGDQVIFDTLDTEANGVNKSTVYFVRDMSGDGFKVALTSGGAAIDITGDVVGTIKKISTPTLRTEVLVSMAGTNVDSQPIAFPCPRLTSTHALWAKAKSKSGDTTLVSFFLDVHSYA